MLSKLWARLDKAERRVRYSFGDDIVTPWGRFWSTVHFHIFDHAFLRVFWTNFWQIAPGVYRSNQPTHRRFVRYKAMGIKTVINLRGEDKRAHYLFEEESCRKLGLTLINAKLHARKARPADRFLAVIEALRRAEKPMIFHCKSGADRAGIVAAIYLMVFEEASVAEARKQLGLKYIHLKFTATGVQDYILDIYEARQALSPIGFEDWLKTEYDHHAINEGYRARRPAADLARPA